MYAIALARQHGGDAARTTTVVEDEASWFHEGESGGNEEFAPDVQTPLDGSVYRRCEGGGGRIEDELTLIHRLTNPTQYSAQIDSREKLRTGVRSGAADQARPVMVASWKGLRRTSRRAIYSRTDVDPSVPGRTA